MDTQSYRLETTHLSRPGRLLQLSGWDAGTWVGTHAVPSTAHQVSSTWEPLWGEVDTHARVHMQLDSMLGHRGTPGLCFLLSFYVSDFWSE